jgi:phospholipase C
LNHSREDSGNHIVLVRAYTTRAQMLTRLFALVACAAAFATAAPRRVNHIVYVMMENHAFDNMLGWLPGVDGVNAPGRCNVFENVTYCATDKGAYSDPDPDHSVQGTATQIFGNATYPPASEHVPSAEVMSGFVASYAHAHTVALAPTIMDCFTPAGESGVKRCNPPPL